MKSNLKDLLKTTSKYLNILDANTIKTPADFFEYYPRTYEDRTKIRKINEIILDGTVQIVKGKIINKNLVSLRYGRKMGQIVFQDEDNNKGKLLYVNTLLNFKDIIVNKWYHIIGKPKVEKGSIMFWHPEIEEINEEINENNNNFKAGRIFPIYPELLGIKSNWFAQKIWQIIDKISDYFTEYFPADFLQEFNLLDIHETIRNIHFPQSIELKDQAKYRIFFEKLLKIQLISFLNKQEYSEIQKINIQTEPNRNLIKIFLEKLPFTLTIAQKKCCKQIIEDFHSNNIMMRLLQGDVGSGKTIVAIIAGYYLWKVFGGQIAFLAPTDVLATQQFRNIAKIVLPLGLNITLIKGSTTKSQKLKIKSDLQQGKINFIVGTHALIQEDIKFANLQLAIVDEQHKFGVMQRAFFKKMGSPHILQMTATPIPRSLALAFFGEFEVSILDELPAGRKPIYTKIIQPQEFNKLKPWFITKLTQNQKIYIVTPLIEESDFLEEVQSATQEYNDIQNYLPEYKEEIGILHGRMKSNEKEEIMNNFKNGNLKILVSTTVIEVGIDVPQATIMIIKNAERFGLSQLHQLRGRVGRSDVQSYCFLFTSSCSPDSHKRLKALEKTNDGFKLAELDLEFRGSGEILGTKQAGQTDIPLEILSNIKFLEKVQDATKWLITKYPNLSELEHLKNIIETNRVNLLV